VIIAAPLAPDQSVEGGDDPRAEGDDGRKAHLGGGVDVAESHQTLTLAAPIAGLDLL